MTLPQDYNPKKLSQRELDEICTALMYVFGSNHGTSGHLAYHVISKLTIMLTSGEQDPELRRIMQNARDGGYAPPMEK